MLLFIGILSACPGAGLSFGRIPFLPTQCLLVAPVPAPPLRGHGPSLRTFQFGHEMFETRNRIASIRTDGSDLQTTGLGLHHQTICQTLRSTTEDMGRRVSCARAGRLGAMWPMACALASYYCIESSSGPTRRRASRRRRPLWSRWRRSS